MNFVISISGGIRGWSHFVGHTLELTFSLDVERKDAIVKATGHVDEIDTFLILLLEFERLSCELL